MSRTQQAIFPCVFIAVLAVVLLTGFVANTGVAQSSEQASTETAAADSGQQSSCGLPQSYPAAVLNWCSLIETYAAKFNLEGRLLAAVILEESGGNPDAYSHSGAVGLMQVMPRDGLAADFTCSGRPCFASRPTMAELYDPEFNISYGARMLAGLIQKLGSERDALKAYGPKDYGYTYADTVLSIFDNYR